MGCIFRLDAEICRFAIDHAVLRRILSMCCNLKPASLREKCSGPQVDDDMHAPGEGWRPGDRDLVTEPTPRTLCMAGFLQRQSKWGPAEHQVSTCCRSVASKQVNRDRTTQHSSQIKTQLISDEIRLLLISWLVTSFALAAHRELT